MQQLTMMTDVYTEQRLKREIHDHLDRLAASHEEWDAQLIALQIGDEHRVGLSPAEESEHVAYWIYTGYTLTRKFTTDCINRRADPDDDTSNTGQLDLPGFERVHLQDYYVCTRNGRDVAVSVLRMTDDELQAQVAQKRRRSAKEAAHADEIERFIDWRSAQREDR